VEWTAGEVAISGTSMRDAFTLRDAAQRPVTGAMLRVEAHMDHPGMAPVVAPARERVEGVYEVQMDLTMGGQWTLRLTGTLADGRRVQQEIGSVAARPSG
jgi:hypothetical protein